MLKLKMMLCVMMLPLVVVGCTSKQSVSSPDDTLSGEIPGVILVDVLGRRWYRQAEFVIYDMFMAPRVPAASLLAVPW